MKLTLRLAAAVTAAGLLAAGCGGTTGQPSASPPSSSRTSRPGPGPAPAPVRGHLGSRFGALRL